MVKPPTDPSPAASTGGVANAQGQAIFTADWNTLINDLYPHALDSLTNHNAQYGTATITVLAGNSGANLNITFPSSFGGPVPEVIVFLRQTPNAANIGFAAITQTWNFSNEQRWEPYPTVDTELFGTITNRRHVDITGYSPTTSVSLKGWITSNNDLSAILDLQYSTDGGATWSVDVLGVQSPALPASGFFTSGSVIVPTTGLANLVLRLVGNGGANAPGFGVNIAWVQVEFLNRILQGLIAVGRGVPTTTGFQVNLRLTGSVNVNTNFLIGWLAFVP